MAKWGEGDPRWVVESRPDGHNVNSWHWEEKNMMNWSRRRIVELLNGVSCGSGEASITGLKELLGAASLSTRKGGKKFITFDLTVVLNWEGVIEEKEVKGEVKVSEFSCTNEPDEYIFDVTTSSSGKEEDQLKQLWKSAKETIYSKLSEYVADLHAS